MIVSVGCYRLGVAKSDLDLRVLRDNLESWALCHDPSPCDVGRLDSRASRSEVIWGSLMDHLRLHGDFSVPNHCRMPCRRVGVALALWEVTGYEQEIDSDKVSHIEALELAAGKDPAGRDRLLELAWKLRNCLDSRPLATRRGGKRGQPRKALCDAICRDLREGGGPWERDSRSVGARTNRSGDAARVPALEACRLPYRGSVSRAPGASRASTLTSSSTAEQS